MRSTRGKVTVCYYMENDPVHRCVSILAYPTIGILSYPTISYPLIPQYIHFNPHARPPAYLPTHHATPCHTTTSPQHRAEKLYEPTRAGRSVMPSRACAGAVQLVGPASFLAYTHARMHARMHGMAYHVLYSTTAVNRCGGALHITSHHMGPILSCPAGLLELGAEPRRLVRRGGCQPARSVLQAGDADVR